MAHAWLSRGITHVVCAGPHLARAAAVGDWQLGGHAEGVAQLGLAGPALAQESEARCKE